MDSSQPPILTPPPIQPTPQSGQSTQPDPSQPTPKKFNIKILILIIVSAIFLAVVAVIIIAAVVSNSSKGNSSSQNQSVTTSTTTSEKTTFAQFEFQHIVGYQYNTTTTELTISNDQYKFITQMPTRISLGLAKTQIDKIKSDLNEEGVTVNNSSTRNINGAEMIIFSITKENQNMYYLLIQAPDNNYVFEAVASNKDYQYEANILEEAGKIFSNTKSANNDSVHAPDRSTTDDTNLKLRI